MADPVAPFLTPDQQAALTGFDTNYNISQGALNQQASDANTNYQTGVTANQKTHDINTDTANWNMAARGLFQSSIRDADLNDINATLTTRNNILRSNLNRTMANIAIAREKLQNSYTTEHNLYNWYSTQNAMNQTPTPDSPAAGAGGVTGTAGAATGLTKGQLAPISTQPRTGPIVMPRPQVAAKPTATRQIAQTRSLGWGA
jgi:hypothetical protein